MLLFGYLLLDKPFPLRKPLLTCALHLLIFLQIHGQPRSFLIPNSPFFSLIRDGRFDGAMFNTSTQFPFRILGSSDIFQGKYFTNLHVSGGEILLSFQATGFVYRSNGPRNSTQLEFTRIDSTELVGYNINHYPFIHRETLYNLGGYGFWRWNGQLRKFNETAAEWDIIPLNREIGISNDNPGSCLWKDDIGNRVVSLGFIEGNQAIRQSDSKAGSYTIKDTVMALDLKSAEWKALGQLNPWLKDAVTGDRMRGNMEDGVMVEYKGEIYLLDIRANQVKKMINWGKRQKLYNKLAHGIFWYVNGRFFIASQLYQPIDSLEIRGKDFAPTGEVVFIAESSLYAYLYWLLAPILMFASVVFIRRLKGKQILAGSAQLPTEMNEPLRSPYSEMQVFDEVEKGLLELLLVNTIEKGVRTGTDEINRILGVAQKSLDMQKRKRSTVIRSINNKFRLLHPQVGNDLIDRVKSEMDARLFEYLILEKDIEPLKKIMNSGI